MTRLEIKSLMSSDVDIATWQPESLEEVWFAIEMEIGLTGDDKADLFQTVVATPEGLRKHARDELISKRGTLVLSSYSPQILRKVLEEILSECSAENWNESVLKLQRYFFWEYEDYVQEDHSP
jgi:hypothetical protein